MISRLKQALHRRRYPQRYALLEQLLRTQALPREQLLAQQQRDLAAIVEHACHNVPYYQRKYAHAELAAGSLPLLRKDEVLQHRDEMVARDVDRSLLKIGNTGGSTGKPLAFYYDNHKSELMRAGMCRSYMWSGWRPGQKILNFWGARQDIQGGASLAKRYGDFIAAEQTIGAYEYSETQLHAWAAAIRAYRPVLLQGYASILAELAGHIVENRSAMPGSILGVFSTAEVLYDWQRALIEEAFQCKVFNQYGSREIPNIACECRHGNQHVFTDMVHLESLKLDGEERFIVTSLTNRAMPFIRYEIGDSGRLKEGECACGSPFPMMEMGLCRSNDIIRTRRGKRIYPSYFIHLLDGLDAIRQYQFIHDEADRLTLNLVAATPLSTDIAQALSERIRREVDADMLLEIHYLDEIQRSVSGKHRFVIGQRPDFC